MIAGGVLVIVATFAGPRPCLARAAGQDADAPRLRRAYKPAERRAQADAAQADAAADDATQAARREAPAAAPAKADPDIPANVTDPAAYKKELDAARAQRDRDLKDAAKETDRRKFQKRQEEIFARYAAILSEMKDRYEASADATAGSPKSSQRQTKVARPLAVRPGERFSPIQRTTRRDVDDDPATVETPAKKTSKSARSTRKGDDVETLDDAQKRLDDENDRHDAAMGQLNKQLADAQASKNKKEVRKAERAIDKENTTYQTKKALLESRVKELGGKIPAPKTDRTPAPAVR
jgi:hypothetical protein